MIVKKIKKDFYKKYSLSKKKNYSQCELKRIEDKNVFFEKKIDINELFFKIIIKTYKTKKQIIFQFFDDKTRKPIKFSRKQSNNIIANVLNDNKKKNILLHLFKNSPHNNLLKKRLMEIYNEVPKETQEWLDEKHYKKHYPYSATLDNNIKVLKILTSAKNLLLFDLNDFNVESEDEFYNYYYDLNTEENIKDLKKQQIAFVETILNTKKLHLKLEPLNVDDENLLVNKFFYEKDCEEINVTKELNEEIIKSSMFDIIT